MCDVGANLAQNDKKKKTNGGILERALTKIFLQVRHDAEHLSLAVLHSHGGAARGMLPSLYLYDGISGVALFLAAYYYVTKEPDAQRLALLLSAPVRKEVHRIAAQAHLTPTVAIGGMNGLGSHLYTFVRLADWLSASEFLDYALRVTTAISREDILRDERLHVMQGCAGMLLALLSFAQEAPAYGIDSRLASDLAVLCGHHLLDRRVPSPAGPRAWPTIDHLPTPGFAHGASGISYALMRLFRHTGREEFREAALEGFAFENAVYMPERRAVVSAEAGWPNSNLAWCQGGAGIALARVGSIDYADVPGVRRSMDEALKVTRSEPLARMDQVCCGNFGRVDVLHTAGTVLKRLHLSQYALTLSKQILSRAAVAGFQLGQCDECHVATDPRTAASSMFTGLSGVGYTLLRLLYPDLFPSMLLLESQM
jgi:lantibiotic modifying enzyme